MTSYLTKLPTVIVDHSTKVQHGETVLIDGPVHASDLLEEIYKKVVDRGAHPQLKVSLPGTREYLLKRGTKSQLIHLPHYAGSKIENAQVTISILGETNIYAFSNVPQENYAQYLSARRFLKNIRYDLAAQGKLRWCLAMYPTDAYAQQMGMSLSDLWEDSIP